MLLQRCEKYVPFTTLYNVVSTLCVCWELTWPDKQGLISHYHVKSISNVLPTVGILSQCHDFTFKDYGFDDGHL